MSDDTLSWTVRLSPRDQQVLADLCRLYGLNRPDTLRRVLRETLIHRRSLRAQGCFSPVGGRAAFIIRLARKEVEPDGG